MNRAKKLPTIAAEAVVNKGFDIVAPVKPENRVERLLQRFDKKVIRLQVRPVTLGTLTRIAAIPAIMEAESLTGTNRPKGRYYLQSEHLDGLTEAAAAILHNGPGEPDAKLIDWIEDNLTYPEMATLFALTLQGLNLSRFIKAYRLDTKKKGMRKAGRIVLGT